MPNQMKEREWVHQLVPRLNDSLASKEPGPIRVAAKDAVKLAYTSEIHEYGGLETLPTSSAQYETDLLISDNLVDGRWVPRVVVECKIGSVTTHDALAYSAKARDHKQVHPYLRYGVLVGNLPSLPGYLVKHGMNFDFMISWATMEPTDPEWSGFIDMLAEEAKASRTLQHLLENSRAVDRQRYHSLRRPLLLT